MPRCPLTHLQLLLLRHQLQRHALGLVQLRLQALPLRSHLALRCLQLGGQGSARLLRSGGSGGGRLALRFQGG